MITYDRLREVRRAVLALEHHQQGRCPTTHKVYARLMAKGWDYAEVVAALEVLHQRGDLVKVGGGWCVDVVLP